jgi:EipB-like
MRGPRTRRAIAGIAGLSLAALAASADGRPAETAQATPPPPAAATAKSIKLAPHRAIYEMSLDTVRSGSGVTDLTGRMAFEITGTACEGYTQNMRFVMETTSRDGSSSTTDMRSSSWEEGLGLRYRFNTSNYRDQELSDATTGTATRSDKTSADTQVELTKPHKTEFKLPAQVMFPIQHSKLLVVAAEAGKTVLEADVYDGSDKGEKVYATTSVIGRAVTAAPASSITKIKNWERLNGLASWPVTISYFEKGKEKEDSLPVYEISFRYYANGVSENLAIDYGDFAIKGALKEIEFYDAAKCDLER